MTPRVSGLRALIVDYGGVLTNPLGDALHAWLSEERVDPARFSELMRTWLAAGAPPNIVHDLERGRLDPNEFERQLATFLRRADGTMPDPVGLLARMFAGFRAQDGMHAVVRRVRAAGRRTALLSNSWGFTSYQREGWSELFDTVLISGEVGMRKPDAEIYLLAAQRLGVPPEACVFVDDLPPNVRGAAAVGMVGVVHEDFDTTLAELEILFEMPLH